MHSTSSPAAIGPLRIGNVVTAGFRLYSNHWQTYVKLSAIAHLWVLVPIYGWAKHVAIAATVSRLAYGELTYQPETVSAARRSVEQRLWSYFGLWLVLLMIYFVAYVVLGLLALLSGFVIGIVIIAITIALFGEEIGSLMGGVVLAIWMLAVFFIGFVWLVSRLFFPETAMAVEETGDLGRGLARSWRLTKKSVLRVQGIVVTAFLVSLPILMLLNYLPSLPLLGAEPGSPRHWVIYSINLTLGLAGNVILLPFWQSIKAVLYYDLRNRREGWDLKRYSTSKADSPMDTNGHSGLSDRIPSDQSVSPDQSEA
jgi:hypothetical protein